MAEICCTIMGNPEQQVLHIKNICVVDLCLITCLSVLKRAVIVGNYFLNSIEVTEENQYFECLRKSP